MISKHAFSSPSPRFGAPSFGLAIGLLLPLIALSACSQDNSDGRSPYPWQDQQEAQVRDLSPPSPAIWEITGREGQQGWLFGTVHALPDDLDWRTPLLDDVMDNSGVLLVEIANLSDSNAAQSAFRAVSTTPGLPPLAQRVSLDDRPMLAEMIDRSGLSQSDLANVESWAASLLLTSTLRTNDPGEGADLALLADHGHAIGLESFAIQYGLFDALSEDAQIELLLSIAQEVEEEPEEERLDAWIEGDMEKLEAETFTGFLDQPELREALLTKRNHDWLGTVARSVTLGEKPLVAVGAAHMLGKDGLPQLLVDNGFDVRRIQ